MKLQNVDEYITEGFKASELKELTGFIDMQLQKQLIASVKGIKKAFKDSNDHNDFDAEAFIQHLISKS